LNTFTRVLFKTELLIYFASLLYLRTISEYIYIYTYSHRVDYVLVYTSDVLDDATGEFNLPKNKMYWAKDNTMDRIRMINYYYTHILVVENNR